MGRKARPRRLGGAGAKGLPFSGEFLPIGGMMAAKEILLAAILRSLAEAMLSFDGDGKITTLNPEAEAIVGWSAEEAVGRAAADVLRIQDATSGRVLSNPALWARDFRERELLALPRNGGDPIPVEGVCSPIRYEDGQSDGYVCVFRNIEAPDARDHRLAAALSELRAANERIESKRSLLDAVFRSIPCGVMAVDREDRIRALNPFLERLFGVGSETVLGRPMREVLGCHTEIGASCRSCAANNTGRCVFSGSACRALSEGSSPRQQIEIRIGSTGAVQSRRLEISAASGKLDGEELCFLMIEDRTEIDTLRRALRFEASFSGIVGRDCKMHDLFETIDDLADSSVPVLVEGESGTGKELVATAIHARGERSTGRFVAVNCGALPDTLLGSELFGYVKGAFTGAVKDRKGRFELADGGTLFLDEVAELSPAMQVELLRVIQTGTFERLGSEKTIQVDVRIISATNKSLEEEVARGRFRSDLYYRLCVVPITIPPLRDRAGDIPLLVEHILSRMAKVRGHERSEISSEVLDLLSDHAWPGNVRELENVLQFAVVRSRGERIGPEHLPKSFVRAVASKLLHTSTRNRLTTEKVAGALQMTRGNKREAAKQLHVSRSTLYRFLNEYAHAEVEGGRG